MPNILLDEAIAGAMVELLAATSRRLALAIRGPNRRGRRDLELARWFDTYKLAEVPLKLPQLPHEISLAAMTTFLGSDQFHALLHELLSVRLTDAPEIDASRVREALNLTLLSIFQAVDSTAIAEALFEYYDNQICDLVGRIKGWNPPLLMQIRNEALGARVIATLQAIERHTASLSIRSNLDADDEFLVRYRMHVAEHHGKIEPPDFQRRRRIPIADIYVPPAIIDLGRSEPDKPPRQLGIWQLDSEADRSVLLGDPGAGKTTAAHVLLHHHATTLRTRVPFLVVLREFAATAPPSRSVVAHIEYKLDTFYQCPAPAGLIIRLLLSGNVMVIFDGLDELIDTGRRADVSAVIERFCTEYPMARVLVTSRFVGYDQARLDDRQFTSYRVAGFDNLHVNNYVHKWFAQEEGVDSHQWTAAFMLESATVSDLRSNPLMLALMCILYRGAGSIPRSRPEVYEQCANLLFRKWDTQRGIQVELRARHLVEPAIRHLAYWLFTRDEVHQAVTERELVRETSAFLLGRGFETSDEATDAAQEFAAFCRGRMWVFSDAGSTATGETLYTFTHRTFLEYFAAAYLAVISDTPEKLARTLAPHVAKEEWDVVAELAVQMKDRTSDRGAERVYTLLLNQRQHRSSKSRSNILQFLGRGLKSLDPSPNIVRQLAKAVLEYLREGRMGDPEYYLPLSSLIENCANCEDVVKDEVASQIALMMNSSDASDHLSGLRLAAWVWLSCFVDLNGRRVDSGLRDSWHEFSRATMRIYRSQVKKAAERDEGLLLAALDDGLVTVKQAVAMKDGFNRLLTGHRTIIFDISFEAYLSSRLRSLMKGRLEGAFFYGRAAPISVLNEFTAIGDYLVRHPNLPWANGPSRFRAVSSGNSARKMAPLPLNSVQYLGAVAVLFVMCENSSPNESNNLREDLGLLSEAFPYIALRWNIATFDELRALPVPDDFQVLFKRWARREVNLIDG